MLLPVSKGSKFRVARSISTWGGLVNYRGGSVVRPDSSLTSQTIENWIETVGGLRGHLAGLWSAGSSNRM